MDEFLQDYEVFDLGDVTLQHGATLRDAKLAYKTYGQLNAEKSNAIVYPTWYSGRHWDDSAWQLPSDTHLAVGGGAPGVAGRRGSGRES